MVNGKCRGEEKKSHSILARITNLKIVNKDMGFKLQLVLVLKRRKLDNLEIFE